MIQQHPKKCRCGCYMPLWRYIDNEWVCLNGPLYDAIYVDRDDNKKAEILALIVATRPDRRRAG